MTLKITIKIIIKLPIDQTIMHCAKLSMLIAPAAAAEYHQSKRCSVPIVAAAAEAQTCNAAEKHCMPAQTCNAAETTSLKTY